MKTFYSMQAQGKKSATIKIFADIGEDWFGEGVSAKGFSDDLEALGDLDILDVHVNSRGGNVHDGVTIYNTLKQHSATVNMFIDGVAASIASIIAMAGDKIYMAEGATMFVHNPLTWAVGNSKVFRATADTLDTIQEGLVDIYSNNNLSSTRDEIIALMDAETTFTAQEAIDKGFATDLSNAVFNGKFDKVELQAQVMASAEETAKDKQLESVTAKLTEVTAALEAKTTQLEAALAITTELEAQMKTKLDELAIAELKNIQMPEATALFVFDACTEAERMPFAAEMFKMKLTESEVTAHLALMTDVEDLCVANGIESDTVLAAAHKGTVEALRVALNEQAVAFDIDINNRVKLNTTTAKMPNVGEIYAARKTQH
ncbi:MAG: Clp protease ClpP [Candidatus Peribacteraceae bacterium]|nr:Clp protease ClpP [Candidatus Peribacteraceae bacterium]